MCQTAACCSGRVFLTCVGSMASLSPGQKWSTAALPLPCPSGNLVALHFARDHTADWRVLFALGWAAPHCCLPWSKAQPIKRGRWCGACSSQHPALLTRLLLPLASAFLPLQPRRPGQHRTQCLCLLLPSWPADHRLSGGHPLDASSCCTAQGVALPLPWDTHMIHLELLAGWQSMMPPT